MNTSELMNCELMNCIEITYRRCLHAHPMGGDRFPCPHGRRQRPGWAGFTLTELILALGVGTVLCAAILQALLLHEQGSERLARLLRERAVQRRTLELIRSEVLRAERLELAGGAFSGPPCGLAGRRPVLQLITPAGAILYSVGAPPSAIWRGQVLMRCGPAYGLDGEPSAGASQNRVLLDGLAAAGFAVSRPEPGQLELRLLQRFSLRDGGAQEIGSGLQMATAEWAADLLAGR